VSKKYCRKTHVELLSTLKKERQEKIEKNSSSFSQHQEKNNGKKMKKKSFKLFLVLKEAP
jgi:hypothetical protein